MMSTTLRRLGWLVRAVALSLFAVSGPIGCDLLNVSDPTAIQERAVSDSAGAELLRIAALNRLSRAVGDGFTFSGLLADEFLSDPPSWAAPGTWSDEFLDRRASESFETLGGAFGGSYWRWQDLRLAASVALPKLQAYAPAAARAHIGEMFAVRGFAALSLAEDICPGFPLHEVVDYRVIYGPPLTTEEALTHTLAEFDSAVAYAADSARILNFARVARARTLLNLARFPEAAAAVAAVPTSYVYSAEFSSSQRLFNVLSQTEWASRLRGVADREGGTGLDFVSANDPRVTVILLGTALDGVTGMYAIGKYPNRGAPIVLASGVEARLIESEAALAAGNPNWLTILNDLRATQVSPPLGALTDPGAPQARVDLLFRERAFWLFATGHRLGDLRRLIRIYARAPESVFPTGAYRLGGQYESATSVPFFAADERAYNPAITGCIIR